MIQESGVSIKDFDASSECPVESFVIDTHMVYIDAWGPPKIALFVLRQT
jgi:hypothetical protein